MKLKDIDKTKFKKISADRMTKKDVRHLKDDDKPIPKDKDTVGMASESKKLMGLSFWDRRKIKKKPEHSFLITMIFSNGTSRRFIISTNEETFSYKKRHYNLRYEDSYFSLTDNQFILFYHEDFVNPIDRELVRLGNEAYFTTTPENIKPIIDMEYVKALSSSIELNKFFRSSLVLMILNLLIGLFNLFMMFKLNKIIKALVGVLS